MMEASSVWRRAYIAFSEGEYATDEATAIIEQAIRDAITEDRRGRTFAVSELDKAREASFSEAVVWLRKRRTMKPPATLWHAASILADQMETAVIRAAFARDELAREAQADGAYDATKRTDHAENELDWTGTPQGSPMGQDGPSVGDGVKEFALCHTCGQYSHSIGEDQLTAAHMHFQSMIAHPVRGHPMGGAFDAKTRDMAQMLVATIARLSAENEALRAHLTEQCTSLPS